MQINRRKIRARRDLLLAIMTIVIVIVSTLYAINWWLWDELDFWGRNLATLNAALGEKAAEEAELAETQLLLSTAIVRAYFRGLAATRQAALACEMVRLRREAFFIAETRFRAGLESEDVIPSARADLKAANKREAIAVALLDLQRYRIARLIGQGSDAGSL